MGVIPKVQIYSLLIHLFVLYSLIARTDSINIPQGSMYVYEIEINEGITFRGEINLFDEENKILVEILQKSA